MNYMGSKSKISKYIVPIIQKEIDENNIHYYLEPFCGGLNVIDKVRCDRKFAYDIDKYLIHLFIYMKEGKELPDTITKEQYDKLREYWRTHKEIGCIVKPNDPPAWLVGCACHLASFNGRDFTGGYSVEGYEKRKDGTVKYRNYYQERKNNLIKQFQQPLCQDIMFGISDYKKLNKLENYLIYADKPYQSRKEYGNSEYFNHDEFWEVMRKWSKDNIVLISELDAPEDFECIWQQEVSRSIKPNDKRTAVEKLFRYMG